MNPVTGLVTFILIWWLIFLGSLPFGVRGQWEDGQVADGSEPGAPVRPMLLQKAKWTTIITAVLWAVVFLVVQFAGLTLDDLPGPDSYWG